MGVQIPLGYGQWTLPFNLLGDSEEMVITCGFLDDDSKSADLVANDITNPLFATDSFAASSGALGYSCGPARVVVNRPLGTFEGVGSVVRTFTNDTMAPPPNNVAILVSKLTTRGGRKGRGRMYLPPFAPTEASIDAVGLLSPAYVAQLNLDLNDWQDSLLLEHPLQLLHDEDKDGILVAPDLIQQFVCSTRVATQRTRLRR